MAYYNYSAVNDKGTTLKGTIEALTLMRQKIT